VELVVKLSRYVARCFDGAKVRGGPAVADVPAQGLTESDG
jgi:hypothetical protein